MQVNGNLIIKWSQYHGFAIRKYSNISNLKNINKDYCYVWWMPRIKSVRKTMSIMDQNVNEVVLIVKFTQFAFMLNDKYLELEIDVKFLFLL